MTQDDVVGIVRICAAQFRFYEGQHAAKGTPEADEKAKVNREFAEMCEGALARLSSPPEAAMVEAAAKAAWNADLLNWGEAEGVTRPEGFDVDRAWGENCSMPLSGPGFCRKWTTIARAALEAQPGSPKQGGEA